MTTKIVKISFQKALEACGPGESVLEVLDTLQAEGVIKGFEVTIDIEVDRENVASIENFFYREEFEKYRKGVK
jgi:hypothetical protein